MKKGEFSGCTAAEAAIKACEAWGVTRGALQYQVIADRGAGPDRVVTISASAEAPSSLGAQKPRAPTARAKAAEEAATFVPRGGFPPLYERFRAQASRYDGRHLPPGSRLSRNHSTRRHAFSTFDGLRLDFSAAAKMTPESMEGWLHDRALSADWLTLDKGKVPLAFFEDQATQQQSRELLCVDVLSPECPVFLFVREGGCYAVAPGLEEFLETLGE
ncbi:MAG: hypothetical protein QM765_39955 [Myxococcales bacterium]